MNPLCAAAFAIAVAVIVQIVFPGEPVYHAGWYNVLLAGALAATLSAGRRQFMKRRSVRTRGGIAILLAGTAVVAISGVAGGLFAPDNETVVGAPGQRVAIESLGTIVFPIATADSEPVKSVTLERPLHAAMEVGERSRLAGSFILHALPRSVVYVEARDIRGGRLTITQPEGSAFLSPVLLMQHRQTIAGMDLPFDSFNVPAAHRVVKAVLFTSEQAEMLQRGDGQLGAPAVLFAVDDENDRPLPNGIALSRGEGPVRAGGLILRGGVASYPAVEVVAVPNVFATAFGTLLLLGGALALLARHDGANVAQDDAAFGELDALRR